MKDTHARTLSGKSRARGIGIPFDGTPGAWNAITDVPGIEVGYCTLIEGEGVRTGVTAIFPRGPQGVGDACAAGFHSQNGNGEMTGISWIQESGTLSGPICITNTHAIGAAHSAIVAWTIQHDPDLAETWLLPVAAETWDGYLNDINGLHVTVERGMDALNAAASGPIEEGSVGGGTGMCCYEFKGGSGTASRIVDVGGARHILGVFVQANFGRRAELVIAGVPLGRELSGDNPMSSRSEPPPGAGSIIAIVATDAPLLPKQCEALARRVTLGLARTGTTGSHFSGDLFLAFSTGNPGGFTRDGARSPDDPYDTLRFIPWGEINPLFSATVQATEEAVINALVANEDMSGFRGRRVPALPRDRVVETLRRRGVQPTDENGS